MRRPLTLAVAQPVCRSHDVVGNVDRHRHAVIEAEADVVVFPELSITGYHFDAQSISADDPRLLPLVEACADRGTTALIGAPTEDEGRRHISMLSVDGDGAQVVYRKMYLGSAEQAHFAPGPAPAVIEVGLWRLGLAICKDTGVSEHAEMTCALGVDVYVAGVLEHRTDQHVQPERARRIIDQHQVWVAVASFAGATGEGFDQAAGRSTIWRPDGTVAATTGLAAPGLARTTIRFSPSVPVD